MRIVISGYLVWIIEKSIIRGGGGATYEPGRRFGRGLPDGVARPDPVSDAPKCKALELWYIILSNKCE